MYRKIDVDDYLRNSSNMVWKVTSLLVMPAYMDLIGYARMVEGYNNHGDEDGIYISFHDRNKLVVCNSLVDVLTEFEYLLLRTTDHAA